MEKSKYGHHYIALAVKDISASVAFYQNLGFTMDTRYGSIKEKWVMMLNGDVSVGLYQDMFPKNILTFNPENARSVYKKIQAAGVQTEHAAGMDKKTGPCSFMMTDPDGNPILVDQHY